MTTQLTIIGWYLIAFTAFLIFLLGRMKLRQFKFIALPNEGLEAKGKILESRIIQQANSLMTKYEFQKLNNNFQTGFVCLPVDALPNQFKVGEPVSVLYLEKTPRINCIKDIIELSTAYKIRSYKKLVYLSLLVWSINCIIWVIFYSHIVLKVF